MLGGSARLFPPGPGGCHRHGLSPLMLAVVTRRRCVCRLSPSTRLLPFPAPPPAEGSRRAEPAPEEWGGGLGPPGTEQPRRRRGILLRRRNSVCASERACIVCRCQSGRVRVCFAPWAVTQHALPLAGTDPALAAGSPFGWLLCPPRHAHGGGVVLFGHFLPVWVYTCSGLTWGISSRPWSPPFCRGLPSVSLEKGVRSQDLGHDMLTTTGLPS